jgi:hypothetical protein
MLALLLATSHRPLALATGAAAAPVASFVRSEDGFHYRDSERTKMTAPNTELAAAKLHPNISVSERNNALDAGNGTLSCEAASNHAPSSQ